MLPLSHKKNLLFAFLWMLSAWLTVANSQPVETLSGKNDRSHLIFAKNHFSFSFIPSVTEKGVISAQQNKYNMHATPQIAFEIGLNYHIHFIPSLTATIGPRTGMVRRNLQYRVPKEAFTPAAEKDVTSANSLFEKSFDATYTALQLMMEKRWVKDEKRYWNLSAGFNVRYAFNNSRLYTGSFVPNTRDTLFGLTLFFGNNNKPWINYNLGGGHAWVLKNNNILQANLLANLSFTQYVKGFYQFTVPGQPVEEGNYGIRGSYLGLSVNYIFTRVNKQLRKKYKNS